MEPIGVSTKFSQAKTTKTRMETASLPHFSMAQVNHLEKIRSRKNLAASSLVKLFRWASMLILFCILYWILAYLQKAIQPPF